MLRDQRQAYQGRYIGSALTNPDFVKLAESFGMTASRVTSPAELKARLAQYIEADRPALIEVPVEQGSEASPWPFLHPAPPVA